MDIPNTIFLLITCAISFVLGRAIKNWRQKKREKEAESRRLEALRNKPPEPESLNKAKRKRQLREMRASGKSDEKH